MVNAVMTTSGGSWKCALTSSSNIPVATNSSFGALTTLGTANGYTAGGATLTLSSSNTTGTETVYWSVGSPTWTGTSANSTAGFTFQAVVFWDTGSSYNLCWFDNGSALTIYPADTLTLISTGSSSVLYTLV